MFGKNRERYVRIVSIVIGVGVILSMVLYTFAFAL